MFAAPPTWRPVPDLRPAPAEMTRFIEAHRDRSGVEPICGELQFAPSSYYATRGRPLSARRVRDEALKVELRYVHAEQSGFFGARKLRRQPQRDGIPVALHGGAADAGAEPGRFNLLSELQCA